MKCTNIILLILAIIGLGWAGYQLRRIADNGDKHAAIEFESYWEVAFVNKNCMELMVRYADSDSMKAVMIERRDTYNKMIGQFKKEQRWEFKEEEKLRKKFEEWFK